MDGELILDPPWQTSSDEQSAQAYLQYPEEKFKGAGATSYDETNFIPSYYWLEGKED